MPHLIRIGILQTLADIIPAAGKVKIDGARRVVGMRPLKAALLCNRILSLIQTDQRVF